MAIDLQKLEQKFNALFEDENTVTEFEQWLKARNLSQNSGKPIVSRRFWVVYPDSVRMGLSDENKPAAWFVYSDHAHRFGKLMWEGFYEVRYEEIHGG